jgi:hypothetical protein
MDIHLKPFASLGSALIFSVPSVILYFMKLYLPLLVYSCVITYLLVVAVANVKYRDKQLNENEKILQVNR